ncbi:type I secretion system permease/ATPase [Methylomonas sp. SURF-2]|uniref:Type I secretion system permease/ATPase n=1 Tax=Methylomonas subterranea TaxID=2952225 RepID=A0ABT1TBK7_9GAMM|nr:type I secretion system permease/ATPase [Methylomonas sp. SURF-2]MCQ8102833.1 type I secretion system permease/ATPase [Methylomonas sp. SURF-2]
MKSDPKSDLVEALTLCRGAFLSAAGFSLVINLLQLVPTIYMLQVYDRVVPTGNLNTLVMLTLILMVLFVTMGILEWVRSQILVRVSTRLEVLLSERLFKVAYKLALYSSNQRVAAQPLDDLTGLRQFMTGNGLFAFFDAPWVPIYLAVMFIFHEWYGWAGVITAILLVMIAFAQEKTTSAMLNEANATAQVGRNLVNKNLRNAEVIDAMGMLPSIRKRWLQNVYKVLELQAIASSRAGLINALSKLIRLSSQSLILALGAYLVIENEITSGLMIAGSILLGRALAPIDIVIGSWKGFISARGQYRRLNELLLKMPADQQKMTLPNPEGAFHLENAVVVPPGAKTPVIKGITMSIVKGDVLGVIGPSGAGKSTFARALLGIWPTSSGRIRLDGAEIYAMNRDELGPFLGYLPQDIELFEGSISENIARFGNVDPEKVVNAAKMADVHELILRLPEGYDTFVGANGINLSGGQRQRIGLARALYGDPVVVVLDEPNSNLDEQGELALAKAIQRLKLKKVTVVIVTHRNNVLANVDKLLILSEGQLSVYGPKEQVVAHLQKNAQQAARQGGAELLSEPLSN